jgi:hypothetical protein
MRSFLFVFCSSASTFCCLVIVQSARSYKQKEIVVLLKSLSNSLQVIGVPVTIDGDLKNQFVETDVGFDTTCKVRVKSSYSVNIVLLVHHIQNMFHKLDVTEDVQVLLEEALLPISVPKYPYLW